tara:strand:- start:7741 stop:8847 length:1107 start_codon:yes stop_codon:yes gene_type:complete
MEAFLPDTRLVKLNNLGQSVWYDNLSREMIANGELKKIIDSGVRGLTSNPSIFEKAISSSEIYDEDIKKLISRDLSDLEIYENLAVQDIKSAADLLKPTFETSNKSDGFVSLEVNPHLANDSKGTIEEAKRLVSQINRDNLMIKVPGTKEGLIAITELISEGINVNVTLIFSLNFYNQVIDSYLEGLRKLISKGKSPSNVSSVASFFVSRVDTAVDSNISVPEALHGKTAISNAKLAYELFVDKFSSSEFYEMSNEGATLQRPLWASTSTKNPNFSDVLYVEKLIGQNTVNTMPDPTLNAFLDHGEFDEAITDDLIDAKIHLDQLNRLGLSLDLITDQLLQDGLNAFQNSFDDLIQNISSKRSTLNFV